MNYPKNIKKVPFNGGAAYVGHAIAVRTESGMEAIVLCADEDSAIYAAEQIAGQFDADRAMIYRAAVVSEKHMTAPGKETEEKKA